MLGTVMCILLVVLREIARTNGQCEPILANDCFEDVETTLRKILNVDGNTANDITTNSLHELCWTLDDALNCTSDIIDTDCSSQEGRDQFDSWLVALREAYFYVCGESLDELYEILTGISCWNIDDFLNCTVTTVNIGHVEDLLKINLDVVECGKLRKSFTMCNKHARVSSCREQTNVEDRVHDLITAFLDGSKCNFGIRNKSYIPIVILTNLMAVFIARVL